ncbi:hypothetical protein B7463_g10768, partial [Scytalidium lignicola]
MAFIKGRIRLPFQAFEGYRCHFWTPHRGVATSPATVQELPRHELPDIEPVQPPVIRNHKRRDAIKDAKPFSAFLTDTFQRQHDYLRISLTEKCNLRCLYCMPEEGVPQSPPAHLLTSPEIFMLSSVFVSQGVTKIRLTGGEPTVRPDIVPLMHKIGSLRAQGLKELCLTTNGLTLARKLDRMVEAGLTGVNLSLDTLDPWQFQIMTRRKGFEAVMKSIERILEMNKLGAGIKLKINSVVMRGMNDREILPFVELGREKDIEVRFIEYMPFDGNKWSEGKMFTYQEMLELIQAKYPDLRKVQGHKNDTSKTYQIPGFVGKIGFITSMTHNFCGTCNRLRITSDGNLKVCLFGNAEVSLRDILRKSNNDQPIDEKAFEAIKKIEEERRHSTSWTTESQTSPQNEKELLEVIGMAVSRKKEKHAGIGELENMKNRPMILIDKRSLLANPIPASIMNTNHSRLSRKIPLHLISTRAIPPISLHPYSTKAYPPATPAKEQHEQKLEPSPSLTHLNQSGEAHMVSISAKTPTKRTATAVCRVYFSNHTVTPLIKDNRAKKGDVLGVARVAGIMAAKRTPDLIPLCHPIAITHVSVDLEVHGGVVGDSPSEDGFGWVDVSATVSCDGKTGVEMEALTAASTAALTVYDMCKAVDKGMRIEGLRVTRKEGGKSGTYIEGHRQ